MITAWRFAPATALAMIVFIAWVSLARAEPLLGPDRGGTVNLDHKPVFAALSQPGVSLAPLPGPAVPAAQAPRMPDAPSLGLGPVGATVGLPNARGEGLPTPEGRVRMGLTDALRAPAGAKLEVEAARPLDLGLSGMLGAGSERDGTAGALRLSLRGQVPTGQDSALSLAAHETMRARIEDAERQIQLRLQMGW